MLFLSFLSSEEGRRDIRTGKVVVSDIMLKLLNSQPMHQKDLLQFLFSWVFMAYESLEPTDHIIIYSVLELFSITATAGSELEWGGGEMSNNISLIIFK